MWAIVNKKLDHEKKTVIKVKDATWAVKLFNPSILGDVEGYASKPQTPPVLLKQH